MPRGKKKPTRKNVTTACLECKKSKTKCTGNTPCGNCTKRVMNRCKACKNNIKDTDISKLEACGKCKTQASKSCEFPQEKPRRGPPPRQTNQKAINYTPFDIKDKNIFGEGMLFDYTKGSMNIEEYNSVNDDSLFSEFIIFEEPISEDDKLSSTSTISTSTIPTATMQIPTDTAIIPGHLPRTEMDLLLGLSQAPPSIIVPLEGQYTAGTQ
ncbi:4295_t:CDS:2 [Entrophospora sp. SA101]|nr:4295_t:CDS:2 [Entrophospora sp. SA101]